MSVCDKCGRITGSYHSFNDGDKPTQWLCDDCHPTARANASWSKIEKIKSRVLMPDGKVLQGREGQRIIDNRLRTQSKT